jgi:hypothetical protein
MDHKGIAKRLAAAQEILAAERIDKATFESFRKLLSGIDPKLDTVLSAAGKAFKQADQLLKGDVLELMLENIPDVTPEDKKRKKAILFFLKFWNDLKSEVARVEKEMSDAKATHTSPVGKIASLAKGPLGVITLIAVAVVALKATEVSVRIQNVGCKPITPVTNMSVRIPGLTLPNETIAPGGEGVAKIPPLTARVDATDPNLVRLNMYGMTFDFSLESTDIRLIFDGKTLNGEVTTIRLGEMKEHVLSIQC